MKLGSSIKRIREDRGIKQNELAERSNISQTYLSQIESNTKTPSAAVVEDLAQALGTPVGIIYFLAMEESDIAREKWGAYKAISPLVKALVEE